MTAADQPTTEPSEGTDWQETAQVLARALKTGDMSEVQDRLDALAPAPQPAADTESTCGWCQHYAPGPPCPLHQDEATLDPDTERDERLRGIQERAEAATEGPWNYGGQGWVFAEAARGDRRGDMADLLADLHTHDEDALFIAAARTDVPWLLVEVTRLDAVVTAVRDLHQPYDLLGTPSCRTCGRRYPCPTVRALDGGAA